MVIANMGEYKLMKIIQSPFFAFVLIGLALFAIDKVYQDYQGDQDYKIELTQAGIERLAMLYAKQQNREVDEETLRQLIRAHIEEQALSREAVRRGLDEDDTIIRRRLAQKMKFIIEDRYDSEPIQEKELRAFYDKNKARYATPLLLSFEHIYLNPRDNEKIYERAQNIQKQVNAGQDWRETGDPFMLERQYERQNLNDINKNFGTYFTREIENYLPEKNQFGPPIGSAYGLHLVRIIERIEPIEKSFDEVREQIIQDLKEEKRLIANQKAIDEVIAKYSVVFQDIAND